MHAHTFTHRCSLFSQAAINLHAWGYESIGERERLKVRKGSKVNRGEQVSYFWSDLLDWQSTPSCPMHEWARVVVVVTPVTHENVNCLVVVSNRSARGH